MGQANLGLTVNEIGTVKDFFNTYTDSYLSKCGLNKVTIKEWQSSNMICPIKKAAFLVDDDGDKYYRIANFDDEVCYCGSKQWSIILPTATGEPQKNLLELRICRNNGN